MIEMNDIKNQVVTIHISYTKEMTLCEIEESLHILNMAFAIFYEKEGIPLSSSNVASPKVVGISNGSLVVDIIVPVACAMLPIVYDMIKTAYSNHKQYTVNVDKARTNWTDEDNYEISKAVLKEYVIKKSNKSIEDFIDKLSLPHIYKRGSMRAKVQNTIQLIKESNIPSSLSIAPLRNYSKAHRKQFEKARKDLRV
jgi:hypothetical protein